MLGLLDPLEPLDPSNVIRTRHVKQVDHLGNHQRINPGAQRKYLFLLLGDQEDQGFMNESGFSTHVHRSTVATAFDPLAHSSRPNGHGGAPVE